MSVGETYIDECKLVEKTHCPVLETPWYAPGVVVYPPKARIITAEIAPINALQTNSSASIQNHQFEILIIIMLNKFKSFVGIVVKK